MKLFFYFIIYQVFIYFLFYFLLLLLQVLRFLLTTFNFPVQLKCDNNVNAVTSLGNGGVFLVMIKMQPFLQTEACLVMIKMYPLLQTEACLVTIKKM